MTAEEIREYYLGKIVFSTPDRKTGGQTVGMADVTVIATIEECNLSIKIGVHRSLYKNKELAVLLLTLAIEESFK